MRTIILLLLLITASITQAQPTLRIGANTRLLGSGSVRLVYGGGAVTNNGSLSLASGQLTATGPTTYGGTGAALVSTAVFNHATGGSTLNSQLSVTGQATVATSTSLNANGQLYLRSDLFSSANLVNNGFLTGTVLGLVTNASQTSATAPFSSTLSTNVSGSSMQYQWQSSPDNSQWTNVSGATSASYTASVSVSTYYRCLLTTTNTNYSQSTPAVLLSVPALTLTTSASPNPVCADNNVALSVTATNGTAPYSYTWAAPAGIGLSGASTSAVSASVGAGVSGVQTFTVTVKDASPTPIISTTVVSLTVNAKPTVTVGSAVTLLNCITTAITLTATGGVSYRWDNNQTTPTINVNVARTYSVTVTDANGCTALGQRTIGSDYTPAVLSLTATNVCAGQSVTLTATPGLVSYSYYFPSGQITNISLNSTTVVSGLTADTYSFSVTARHPTSFCSATATATATATVSPLPTPTIAANPGNTLTCAQTSLTLTATGGTSYTFTGPGGGIISQDQANGSAVIGTAGTYTVTVSNSEGCVSSTTIAVSSSANNLPTISLPTIFTATPGFPVPGGLLFTASGGAGNYTFNLSPLPPGFNIGLTSGTQRRIDGTPQQTGVLPFSLTVTDGNGCSAVSAPYALSVNCSNLTITVPPITTATVGVSIFSTLTWSVAGSAGTYTFAFSTLPDGLSITQSSPAFRALGGTIGQAGTYPISLTVTDSYGCSVVSAPYTLTVNCPTLSLTTPSYSTALTGIPLPNPLAWQVSGGGRPYSFKFSSFPAGLVANNVFTDYYDVSGTPAQSGTFPISVTVTDVNGCSVTNGSYSLTTICPTLAISTTTNLASCTSTGSIAFTTTLPNGTYSLSYVGADSPQSVSVSNGVFSLTGLSAGSYSGFSINYGSTACLPTVNSVVVMTAPTTPTPTLSASNSGTLTCSISSLTLTAGGGNSYAFAGPGIVSQNAAAGTAVVNASGTYSVTVTNTATGCFSTTTTDVSSNTDAPTVSISPTSATLTCSVTSVTLTASGSTATYRWTGNSSGNTLVVSTPGTYQVTATSANGCTAVSNSVVVSQDIAAPVSPQLTASNSGTLTCAVTSLTLTASATGTGLTYAFAGPSGTVAGSGNTRVVSAPGTYTVTITGSNGCTATATTTISSNTAAPTVSVSPTSATLSCAVTSVTLTASGSAATYRWTGNSTANTLVVSTPGTYQVTATSANGCTAVSNNVVVSQDVTAPPTPVLSASPSTTLTCAQTSLTLTASGASGTTFQFVSPSVNGFNSTAGSNNAVPASSATQVISQPGTYTVIATAPNGCTSVNTITIFQSVALPTATLAASGTLTCSVTSVTLTAGGGNTGATFAYAFAGPGIVSQNAAAGTAVVNASGTYSVTVTNTATGCFSVTNTTVSSNTTTPTATLAASGTLTCTVTSVTLTATGGNTYAFAGPLGGGASGVVSQNTTLGTAVVNASGTYSVTVTNTTTGCFSTTTTTVSSNTAAPTTSLTASTSSFCAPGSVTLTAGGGVNYAFSGPGLSQSGANNRAVVTQGGTFSVVVTSSNGCTATATTSVTANTPPAAPALSGASLTILTSTTPQPLTGYVTATGSNTLAFYNTSGLFNPPVANISAAGVQTFSAVQVSPQGCVSSATVFSLTVISPLPPSSQSLCRSSAVVLNVLPNGVKYQWYRSGIKLLDVSGVQRGTSTSSLTLISIQTSGTYTCQVTDASGAVTTYGPFAVQVILCNTREAAAEPLAISVNVVPNPVVGGRLRAKVGGAEGQRLTAELSNEQGRLLGVQRLESAQAEQWLDWDVSQHPSGLLFLRVSTDQQSKTVKVVKE